MPGFVKTPKDEARWEKAKQAASKETKEGTDSFWRLSNYIYHRMGKSIYDTAKAVLAKQEMQKFGDMMLLSQPSLSTKIPSATKTGISTSVKMPKPKSMPKPNDKPSKFFKSENKDFSSAKHPTLRKLRSFLNKEHKKNK